MHVSTESESRQNRNTAIVLIMTQEDTENMSAMDSLSDMPSDIDNRIKIAVLQNELKHERQAKEAALASSQQIISSLAAIYSPNNSSRASGTVGHARSSSRSNQRLRKNNKRLKDELEIFKNSSKYKDHWLPTRPRKGSRLGSSVNASPVLSTLADNKRCINEGNDSSSGDNPTAAKLCREGDQYSRDSPLSEVLDCFASGDLVELEPEYNNSLDSSETAPTAQTITPQSTTEALPNINSDIGLIDLDDILGPEVQCKQPTCEQKTVIQGDNVPTLITPSQVGDIGNVEKLIDLTPDVKLEVSPRIMLMVISAEAERATGKPSHQ